MSLLKNKCIWLSIVILVVAGIGVVGRLSMLAHTMEEGQKTVIVLDAGHGGFDPGKVGANGVLEKDLNLQIAIKLKDILEQDGFVVLMTRQTDEAVAKDTNQVVTKQQDMKERVARINDSGAALAVSIHQNSFTDSVSFGAQVFYYEASEEGKKAALLLQASIKETLMDGNHREAKANNNYYMLKNTKCPLVIVECGFLSNPKEAALLMDGTYQAKIASGIEKGIKLYLQQQKEVI